MAQDTPLAYCRQIKGAAYGGFNLLVGDASSLVYASNREAGPRELAPGVYGLSNHRLNTPWPKLLAARERFSVALDRLPDEPPFFELLADARVAEDHALPDTGIPYAREKMLSAVFVVSENYGTRASTVARRNAVGHLTLHERNFAPDGRPVHDSVISTGV